MATEKRMIEPNALLEEITAMKVIDPYKKQRGFVERWVRDNGYDILIQLVKHFPTVDAVEVVRCKDCRHYHADTLSCDFTPHGKYYERPNWYEDDFCSYGERKDND